MTELIQNSFFDDQDCRDFREWLNLNWASITWHGKYEEEFLSFWSLFFLPGLSIEQLMDRYEYAKKIVKVGPLVSWMSWLQQKNLCYLFLKKNMSLENLAQSSKIVKSSLALILRDFFIDKFPQKQELLNEIFQMCHHLSEKGKITSIEIVKLLNEDITLLYGTNEDEVMASLEVTLYEQWNKLIEKMKIDFLHGNSNIEKYKDKTSIVKQLKFLQEVCLLLGLAGLMIAGTKTLNQWYEENLSEKIKIFEPHLRWIDENLSFKEQNVDVQAIQKDIQNMEKMEEKEQEELSEEYNIEERYETESEVALTSVDALPHDFKTADWEKSHYEETQKGGYRDERDGNKKVYRLLMRSINPQETAQKLHAFLKKYQVTQVNTVRPGTAVPGGIYYNVSVSRELLKEFLSETSLVEDSHLYESNSRRENPAGKNRVFIWIKEI